MTRGSWESLSRLRWTRLLPDIRKTRFPSGNPYRFSTVLTFFAFHLAPAIVQQQFGNLAVFIYKERDFCIFFKCEKSGFGLGIKLHFGFSGQSYKQPPVFFCDDEREIIQPVFPHITI